MCECVCVSVGEEVFVCGSESVWASGCARGVHVAHVTNRWMLDAIGTPELLHYGCVLVYLFTLVFLCDKPLNGR